MDLSGIVMYVESVFIVLNCSLRVLLMICCCFLMFFMNWKRSVVVYVVVLFIWVSRVELIN